MAYDLVILAGAGLLLLAAQPKWVKPWPRAVACVLLWILPLWGLSLNLYLMPVAPLVIALFAWQVYSSVNLEPSENRNPRPDPPA